MCEADDAVASLSQEPGSSVAQSGHRGQKRLALAVSAIFVIAVGVTVAVNWPGPCQRAAKRICEAAWAKDCTHLRRLVEAHADEALCREQLGALRAIDARAEGKLPKSYQYLEVVKTLIGTDGYSAFEGASQP